MRSACRCQGQAGMQKLRDRRGGAPGRGRDGQHRHVPHRGGGQPRGGDLRGVAAAESAARLHGGGAEQEPCPRPGHRQERLGLRHPLCQLPWLPQGRAAATVWAAAAAVCFGRR